MITLVEQILFFVFCLKCGYTAESPCAIELDCVECIPDNMPLITSHQAINGSVIVPAGDEVTLACNGGKFLAYPLLEVITARCQAGRYVVLGDAAPRHLLDLGCQEDIFEDVLHQVSYCQQPLQGRAYRVQEAIRGIKGTHGVRHLVELCFDEDSAVTVCAHMSNMPRNQLNLPAHSDTNLPITLLGNFNHMFDAKTRHDAERLYSDDTRMNRRLHELFKHDKVTFADQKLTTGKLLNTQYFEDQNTRVTDFASNKVAVWQNVVSGNLQNIHRDVGKFMKMARPRALLDLYTGTHGVLSLRTEHSRSEVYLRSGKRFPVPKYIWTVVHDKRAKRALAIVLLNDPFVAVSEIKESVFCESGCGRATWLHELRRNRNYEVPSYGLVFCCEVHNFTETVTEMPKSILNEVPVGEDGMLHDLHY